MAEQELQDKIKAEIEALHARMKDVKERNDKTVSINEHIVTIIRLDDIKTTTFLELAERSISDRRRSSWYGYILEISDTPTGDDIMEVKKKKLKVGDIVIFNPESAYCLNIAEYDELWILHIDNILKIDTAYDYMKAREENIRKKLEIQDEIRKAQIRNQSVVSEPSLVRVPIRKN